MKIADVQSVLPQEDVIALKEKAHETSCKKGFSCLSGEMSTLCKVELCIEDKIHFIKCANNKQCSYKISFGYSYVCVCPVRKELYNHCKI